MLFLASSMLSLSLVILFIRRINLVMDKVANRPRRFAFLRYEIEEQYESYSRDAQKGHNYIGSEHLLLGLLREGEGVQLVSWTQSPLVDGIALSDLGGFDLFSSLGTMRMETS
ncbi:hypothetical protein DY000_02026079 [Brassica cretica]|uniref:Clp R domain-containing protein n=1 Tax=Brassica cretica TaxID=69181 RepID=A0ABQ7EGN4_BRACR|nr:hypothetical protein DY000_02026079 [Brassica cretica]